jgi:Cd2+/Zn2+-exporting ATPase
MDVKNPNSICSDCCEQTHKTPWWKPVFSLLTLLVGIGLDYWQIPLFQNHFRIGWYMIAYIPVAWPVLRLAYSTIITGDVFTEFFLMGLATIGAFALGEYPEAVTVMLFYSLGELAQEKAVGRARGNIKALLDVRPKNARVRIQGQFLDQNPESVKIGSTIQVRKGEKIPLDGILQSNSATLNSSTLTGESRPQIKQKGELVYAGSINESEVVEIMTTKCFGDTSMARILDLVENATALKSKTELFIRKFARIYTPIVFFMALSLTFLPYAFVDHYQFSDWFYRALVFLVISCPCALVISIPLGYFGGLGAASKNGILFKGASFLDTIAQVNTIALDKTGTLTQGNFTIQSITTKNLSKETFMAMVNALETQSTHPIAKTLGAYPVKTKFRALNLREIKGMGISGTVNHSNLLIGNGALFKRQAIPYPPSLDQIVETLILVGIDGQYAGHIVLADSLKPDAQTAISGLKKMGIQVSLLSGDKTSITKKIAKTLGIENAQGGLLPDDKFRALERLKTNPITKIAFVGDGINDAPVLAAADIGIAMGEYGSDVAIETADMIIQNDKPSKIVQAIDIGKSTRKIVWQNIFLAFGVKALVLTLGAGGLTGMWEAVFADVGVALLAIGNAVRLQHMQWPIT